MDAQKAKPSFPLWSILKDAADGWMQHRATSGSAALAYYTLFSIAPLLLISLAIAGAIFGEEASRGEVFSAIKGLVGSAGAATLESMIESASNRREESGSFATVVGVVTLLVGASSVFAELQSYLNYAWNVEADPGTSSILNFLKRRLISFSMVFVIGFLLLVSLLLSAALSAFTKFFAATVPALGSFLHVLDFLLSFSITTLLFAAIFKVLPDVSLQWKDMWLGALMTSVFFSLGKILIGLYLGAASVTSSYGVVGSAVVLLLWAFYASAVLFFGAEFTRAIVTHNGSLQTAKKGFRLRGGR